MGDSVAFWAHVGLRCRTGCRAVGFAVAPPSLLGGRRVGLPRCHARPFAACFRVLACVFMCGFGCFPPLARRVPRRPAPRVVG